MLDLAVHKRQAVGRMVIRVVIRAQRVPRHIRDGGRFAAGHVADHGAGRERALIVVVRGAFQRHGTLHLVVHRAGERHFLVRAGQRVAPRLAAEDAFVRLDHRMEARIQIEIGVLQQLILGQRADGIGCHHRVGARVHVGVVGLVAQVEEELLGRILFGARQRGVLKHVRRARVVLRDGAEGDVEHAVGVLVEQQHPQRAGFVVPERDRVRADEVKGAHVGHGESVVRVANLPRRAFGLRGQHG